MTETLVNVNILSEQTHNKSTTLKCNSKTTAEDVCIRICRDLGIGTLARHLFALRITGQKHFLIPSATFTDKKLSVDLRIRFKPVSVRNLSKIDAKAYEYYFHQARTDVLENKIPDLILEKFKKELIGLGITDMYRVMVEKDIPRDTIVNEYKKYMPKEVIKRHQFFIKKPIFDNLGKLQKAQCDAAYIISEYLRQLDHLVPEYLSEGYKALIEENGSIYNILLKISPYHPTEPGLKYSYDSKKDQWKMICTIDDLGFISIRNDGTVELARKNGIPFYFKFLSNAMMYSFISCLDGYYRLTCKWTFNICKDVSTPSLKKLFYMRCHGPVGGEFSYSKLEEKRNNKPGCFIIRESETKYTDYFIDVCVKDSTKPKTFKLEKMENNEYIFNDDVRRFPTISALVEAYSDPNGSIFLQEWLPPSEYDISPLLLCRSESVVGHSLTDSSAVFEQLPTSPLCINSKDLQVYKGSWCYTTDEAVFLDACNVKDCDRPEGCTIITTTKHKGQKKEGPRGITVVYRSMWKVTKNKKIEVAMKVLKQESSDRFLKDFLMLAGQWAFLQSNAIVKLFGITLTSNISIITEYFRLGPLDQYLRDNSKDIKPVDLIEAARNLAVALWHLKENNIVHGNIRCRKLMVHSHEENSFIVKLTDPGIHSSYPQSDVFWIPIECYTNFDYARMSEAADVWAFGTTLWEMFSLGMKLPSESVDIPKFYNNRGPKLPKPQMCPNELYTLMNECWDSDPHRRKQPQAIMRDVSQILYEMYNSRRVHSYAKVKVPVFQNGDGTSMQSLYSNKTDSTFLGQASDLVPASDVESVCSGSSFGDQSFQKFGPGSNDMGSFDFSKILCNFSTATTSLDSLCSMQSAFELDEECHVILQGKIGQGFYGEVFKGLLEYNNKDQASRKVAVKKLLSKELKSIADFEREINIMKELKHPNIVEILGVFREDDFLMVMEFIQHGSLQSYLKINKDIEVRQRLNYALDVANGMEYLGTKSIVHRDLAARNILVVDKNQCKISDFGLAQVVQNGNYYVWKTNRELPIKWFAPESLRDGKFSKQSDVWSYGVTMCEMFNYGEEPQLTIMSDIEEGPEQQMLLNALEMGARFPCPPACPHNIYTRIIHPCFEADPHDRPEFNNLKTEIEQVLKHQY